MLTLLVVLVVGVMACKKEDKPEERGKLPEFIQNLIGFKSQMNVIINNIKTLRVKAQHYVADSNI